jgi:hypothetical protein
VARGRSTASTQAVRRCTEVKQGTKSSPSASTSGSRTAVPSVNGRCLAGSGTQSWVVASSVSRAASSPASAATAARVRSIASHEE